jgi:hypothetical protein
MHSFMGGGWAWVSVILLLRFYPKDELKNCSWCSEGLRLFCKDWLCSVGLCALQKCLKM